MATDLVRPMRRASSRINSGGVPQCSEAFSGVYSASRSSSSENTGRTKTRLPSAAPRAVVEVQLVVAVPLLDTPLLDPNLDVPAAQEALRVLAHQQRQV